MKKILFVGIVLTIMLILNDWYGTKFLIKGYLNGMREEDTKIVISNYKELQKYCENYNGYNDELDALLEKYDENFFESNSIALIYEELSSGSKSLSNIRAKEFGDKVYINYEVTSPEVGTCDMSGYLIAIKTSKNIKNIVCN